MFFDVIKSIVYGIVQGLTEFLPVSSSGHLVILHDILPLNLQNEISFDVILHFGTLVAVLAYFYNDLINIIKSFFNNDKANQRLGKYLILATIPAGFAGYFFDDLIANIFRSVFVVVFMLVLVGILFIFVEYFSKKTLSMKDFGFNKTFLIGCAQVLALIPGTSRSGITIVAGMFLGFKRDVAARFSFLLSVPVILGAVALQMPKLLDAGVGDEFVLYIFAFLSSLVSGFWAIRFLLKYITKNSLTVFAYYRFALALLVIVCMLMF